MKRSSDAGNGGVGRRRPLDLQLARGADRLLFALADDRDVVAAADDLHEAGDVLHRRLVDRLERGADHRRPDVARVQHAGHFHVHGPALRAVHLGGNVVAARRLADVLHRLHRLQRRLAGGRVDVAAGQRDVELLPADQLAVGDARARRCRRCSCVTTPSLTVSDATGTPKCAAAMSSSTRRASAATRRIG